MKVINICSAEAESIQQLNDGEVLISIHEEFGPAWKLQVSGEKVLNLKFSDVRAVTPYKDKYLNPMLAEDAHKIIQFIENYEPEICYVNCAMGVARSGAVALALNILFKYQLKPYFYKLSECNPFCLGMIINEYYKYKAGVYNEVEYFSF